VNAIPARVYVLNSSDVAALKKILEYDPYLDPNLIPKTPKEWDDPKYMEKHPELKAEAEKKKKESEDALSRLKNDKELNTIFARQDYQIKDGISLGLDREKSYLYLNADEAFLDAGEAKLKKNITSLQRAPKEVENQIIDRIEEERQKSDQGLGFIFG
jgi:oligoendopeptidase F